LDEIYNFELAMLPKHSQLRHDVESTKSNLSISPRNHQRVNFPSVTKSWRADVCNDRERHYFTGGVKTELSFLLSSMAGPRLKQGFI
jgi:hypothetical protein